MRNGIICMALASAAEVMDPVVYLAPSCGLRGRLAKSATTAGNATSNTVISDVNVFLGVPYAEPPVRFSDPRPSSLWNGIRDATRFGAVCPQKLELLDAYPYTVPKPKLISEDCLFLNIWTPSLDSRSQLPVMFWIHGGAFASGFSDVYGGQTLASLHKVVVVTINYRIGPLGFLCTNDSSFPGNYGILDQIEALKWVKKYIANFGGDPGNVTIFGESAGSMSVSLLVLSSLTKGLFRRAIAESGTAFSGNMITMPPKTAEKYLRSKFAKKFPDGPPATATSAEIVDFLRRQPVDAVVELGEQFWAVQDGRILSTSPQDVYTRAAHNHVDLLLGSNSDEGAFLFVQLTSQLGIDPALLHVDLARMIIQKFVTQTISVPGDAKRIADAVADEYLGSSSSNESSPEDLHKIMVEFFGDMLFVIPTIRAANYHSRVAGTKTFLYYFSHRPSFSRYPEQWIRADHGSEMFFLLKLPDVEKLSYSDEERELSRRMMSYWTNFAKTGNPNGEGLPNWPEYNEKTQEHVVLQIPMQTSARLKEQRASFWLQQLPKLETRDSTSKL